MPQAGNLIAHSTISLTIMRLCGIIVENDDNCGGIQYTYGFRFNLCEVIVMTLYHFTERENLASILKDGLHTSSRYEAFTKLRKDVVYCWLTPADNRLSIEDGVCLEVTVNKAECIVASMDYISMAMMYKYGGEKYGGIALPVNERAAALFAELYEVTAIPLPDYQEGSVLSPEVLVSGNIDAKYIKIHE